jgi:WD40 repeat protein
VLRTIARRNGAVASLAFNRTGTRLASAGADGVVSVTTPLGDSIWTDELARPVAAVSWAANGSLLGAARNGLVRIWHEDGVRVIAEVRHRGVLRAAALSPDARIAATGGDDRLLRLWDIENGVLIKEIPHAGRITAVAFSHDGKLLASAAGRTVFLWRMPSGRGLKQLLAHSDTVTGLAFSPDDRHLASSSEDHNAVLWNVRKRSGEKLLSGHTSGVNGVAFSSDGRWLLTAGARAAGVWQVRRSELPRSFLFFLRGHERPLTSVAFSPQDWRVATAGGDGTIRTYTCALCGGPRTLITIARARLATLTKENRAQG